jgi:hypothetical protein
VVGLEGPRRGPAGDALHHTAGGSGFPHR